MSVTSMGSEQEYLAVKQLARVPQNAGQYVKPEEIVTVLQFDCHYCRKVQIIDPNSPKDAELVANMLKVQTADGKAYAFCDVECLKPGAKYFKQNPLVFTGRVEGGFEQQKTGIILTDVEQRVVDAVDAEFETEGA
jgi:hypothetical protein